MHWVTAPGHVASGGDAHHDRSLQRAARDPRRPQLRRRTSARPSSADEPYGVEFGENWISIDPAVDYDKTHAAVLEVVNGYPGLRRDVQTYLKERIREVLTGSSDAIVIRIYGAGPRRSCKDLAEDVEEKLGAIPGIIDLHSEQLIDIPQIQVEVDLAKAQALRRQAG